MHENIKKQIKISSRPQDRCYNWGNYIGEITDEDHAKAAQLYCILKKDSALQQNNYITERHLNRLFSCATQEAVNAIKNYENKKWKTENNRLSWLDHEYWLLPSVEILKEKVHQEIAKIPAEMMNIYTTNNPADAQHAIARFLQEEQKAVAQRQEEEQGAEENENEDNDNIEEEYCIIVSEADIIPAITQWKNNPSKHNTAILTKTCKDFNSGNKLMTIIQEYSKDNLSDRQLSALLVETDLVSGVLGDPGAFPYLKDHYKSRLVSDIIAKKHPKK